MKRCTIAIALFCGYASSGWAVCQTTGGTLSHTSEVMIDEPSALTQPLSSVVSVTFSGIKCDSAKDTIAYIPLVKESVIGPFSNGQKLKMAVQLAKTSETIGTTSATAKTLNYTVTLSHAGYEATTGSVESINIPGVLVANTGGNSNFFIDLILGVCKTLSWSGCVNYITNNLKGDSYVENLTVTYRPKKSTCRPDDLSLTLPDVAMSELPTSGIVPTKSRTGAIALQCRDLLGTGLQASRGMAVYLYSADLLSGSRSVLKGSESNGVGFVLESGGKRLSLSTVKGAKDSADNLWRASAGQALNASTLTIPLTASYYVYDRRKVQPGALQATALIFVNYE